MWGLSDILGGKLLHCVAVTLIGFELQGCLIAT